MTLGYSGARRSRAPVATSAARRQRGRRRRTSRYAAGGEHCGGEGGEAEGGAGEEGTVLQAQDQVEQAVEDGEHGGHGKAAWAAAEHLADLCTHRMAAKWVVSTQSWSRRNQIFFTLSHSA